MATYTVSTLTTVVDCDLVISMATKKKDQLEFQKTALERLLTVSSENSVEIEEELIATNAELTAEQTLVSTLSNGAAKKKAERKVKQLEYKQYLLTTRQIDFNSVAKLNRERDLMLIQKQLDELTTFIAEVEAWKRTL